MRSLGLLLLGGLCLGCAEQHGARGRASSSADAADAGSAEQEPDPEPPEPDEPDVYAALDEFLAAIRDFTKSSCACVAEAGDFTSRDECLQSHRTVFGWRECAMRGLAELDPARVRRQLGCQTEEFYMRSECMNEVSCSAGTDHAFIDCQSVSLGCPELDDELIRALSEACTPDREEAGEAE